MTMSLLKPLPVGLLLLFLGVVALAVGIWLHAEGYPNDADAEEQVLPEGPLPDGLKMSTRFRDLDSPQRQVLTVREKLTSLGARYQDGRWRDQNGREISFFLWPFDHHDSTLGAARDMRRVSELKKTYTVIFMNTHDVPHQEH